ncbi:MAG: hypothetical protein Q9224_006160 [Gallowayella concinna]
MSESFQNVAGWCKEDDERVIACAYHIRSADPRNIAKYISVVRDRLVLDGDITIQFDYLHAEYKKWKEVEADPSATGSLKKPSTYNVVHYWAVLWSDEEERRSLEHEKRITDIKTEYDWALNNWSEFQRTSRSGKKSSRRYSPRPSPSEAYKSEFLEHPARDSIMKELIEPLYRSAISCDNKDHQKVVQLGKRPFFIHQWDNPITIGTFPKKHHFTSGDMQIIHVGTMRVNKRFTSGDSQIYPCGMMTEEEVARILGFVWIYIQERQPWEEPREFTVESVKKANLQSMETDLDAYYNICQSCNGYEESKAMLDEAGFDGSARRAGSKEEREQRITMVECLRREFKAYSETPKKSSFSRTIDKVKGKLGGYENLEGVRRLSGVVQPSSSKNN